MHRILGILALVAGLVLTAVGTSPPPILAQACPSLQSQVNAAATGSTWTPCVAQYFETVTVNRAMTIAATPYSGTEIFGSNPGSSTPVRNNWVVATVPGVKLSGFAMKYALQDGIVNATEVSGSNLQGAGWSAVRITGITGASVHDTYTEGNGAGITLVSCTNCKAIDNRHVGNWGHGVQSYFSNGVEIARTDFDHNGNGTPNTNGGAQIWIVGSDANVIHHNYIIWGGHGFIAETGGGTINTIEFRQNMIAMGPKPAGVTNKYSVAYMTGVGHTNPPWEWGDGILAYENGYYHHDGQDMYDQFGTIITDGGDVVGENRFVCRGVAMSQLYGQFNPSTCEESGGYTFYSHVYNTSTMEGLSVLP